MKKMDKKGFTLIELLAVIVILAIIMVIAVPQILNVIEKSRSSAWESNIKMIEEAIETNEALVSTNMAESNGTISVLSQNGCKSDNIVKIVDIDTTATTITTADNSFTDKVKDAQGVVTTPESCEFKVSATEGGEFKNQDAQTITCTPSGCSHAKATESGE